MKTQMIFIIAVLLSCWAQAQQTVYNKGNLNIAKQAQVMIAGNFVNAGTATLENNGKMNLKKDFTNSGSFVSDSGLTEFTGSTQQQITGSSTFYNLRLNNTSTGIILNSSINISHGLTMDDGDLDLNGSNIELGPLATIYNETNAKRIFGNSGTITTTRNLNAPTKLNIGGMGVLLTTAANLGITTITRGHASQINGSDYSVQRYFDISPTNNASLDAKLKFTYFDNELSGLTESDMVMWRSADAGVSWAVMALDSADYSENYAIKSGIGSFSRWTISGLPWGPLAVDLLQFNANCNDGQMNISWNVASETNNSHFTLARSLDGSSFEQIAIIPGAGNGAYHEYSFIDDGAQNAGTVYYRLQQTDFDGSEKTFPAINAETCQSNSLTTQIHIYPNPFTEMIYVYLVMPHAGSVTMDIYDASSKLIRTRVLDCIAGTNEFGVGLQDLAKGKYHINISQGILLNSTIIMKN
jgi:hypothetical protein